MAETKRPLTDDPGTVCTPTPWRIADIVGGESLSVVDQAILIRDEQTDNWVAAVTTDGTISRKAAQANAEFIVRAVNSHEELMELAHMTENWDAPFGAEEIIKKAKAILAKL